MRVSQAHRSNAARRGRSTRTSGANAGEFQVPTARSSSRRANVHGAASVSGIDAIVALQSVDGPEDRRRKAVETGGKILDLLDKVKIGLLSGNIRRDDLSRLKKMIEQQQDVLDDPGLSDVLKQIDLRARVEMAKLKGHAA